MSVALHPDSLLVRTDDALAANVDGEVVMLHPSTGNYFGLNVVGARIWELLESSRSFGDLCERLLAEFEIDEQTCAAQAAALLAELEAADLVAVAPAT